MLYSITSPMLDPKKPIWLFISIFCAAQWKSRITFYFTFVYSRISSYNQKMVFEIHQSISLRSLQIHWPQPKLWKSVERACFHLIILSILFEINCNVKCVFRINFEKLDIMTDRISYINRIFNLNYNEQINICIHHTNEATQKVASAPPEKNDGKCKSMETLHSIEICCICLERNKLGWKMMVGTQRRKCGWKKLHFNRISANFFLSRFLLNWLMFSCLISY